MKEKEEEETMWTARGRQGRELDASSHADYDDYGLEGVTDRIESSRGSRFNLIQNELRLDSTTGRKFSHERLINGIRDFSEALVIHPENRLYKAWMKFILIWAVYSSFFTPMEFGFFRGLPERLQFLDIAGQFAFFLDIILQFFVAYRDSQTYRMVYNRAPIALRYMKSTFVLDLLSCLPWDDIYKLSLGAGCIMALGVVAWLSKGTRRVLIACGKREGVRYLMWIRLIRLCKVSDFFHKLEKDIRVNFMFTRIVKLIVVELYCTHTAACIFYYLATTLPPSQEGYTWIGSLKMGDYSYSHFREIDIWTRYTTSMYFAIVTMTTVGYGDIHAVNMREMIFIMIYVSFDMVLGAYLIGNMTAIIVKGSRTEIFRDKMTDMMKYMNRNRLGRDIRNQVKGHLRLQYEHSYTEAAVLQEIPISIRAKISQTLYLSYIENVALFQGCSSEFINQIVIRVHEEFFLPGEVIMEPGTVVDQLYFVCHGILEEVGVREDGSEESVSLLQPNSSFGEVSIICNIPHPYTVRVCELCRLLRLDKQSFTNILEIYFCDGRKILNNLLEGKESNVRLKQLESDITFHIGRQEAELSLKVNSAAYHGDLHQLKGLIRAGADPNRTDYDGRSPLHIAASRGFEDVTSFLLHEGVQVNLKDNFGNTSLLEALKNGHDGVAALLVNEGASFDIENAGTFLCTAVVRGESGILKRVLSNGMDPNSKDYDHRTPLHVAASKGLYLMAKLLVEAGASIFLKDRWGNTPLDEGRTCGNKNLVKLLEDAKDVQLAELPSSQEITDNLSRTRSKFHSDDQISRKGETLPSSTRKCTVFPFHPWDPKERRTAGIVLWVPLTVEELITTASENLQICVAASCILSEDAGKILDASMIDDGQKLYLVSQKQ